MDLDLSTLRQPVLVAAFRGWNDAGQAATGVLLELMADHQCHDLLTLDESYYDLKQTRPVVDMVEGQRVVRWPQTQVLICRTHQRDVVIVLGDEPNVRWRDFCSRVLDAATMVGSDEIVVLGGLITDEPHSRSLPVMIETTHPELVWGLGAEESSYTGPTGITGVLSMESAARGLKVVSMWVSVPCYGPDEECHKAILALARRVSEVLGVDFDFARLERRAEEWERTIDALITEDEHLSGYVEALEKMRDQSLEPTSGETLAAQIEEYLREKP